MNSALELNNIKKHFGRRVALDGLSLSVSPGLVVGLVGSNGAGKTTTMAIILGFLKQNAGTVNILGQGPFDPVKHAGRVTLMPQDSELPREARVKDLLMFYALLQGLSRRQAEKTISDVLDWVHLTDRADSRIRTLSHGMRRRAVLAQAFIGNPELVILDEPLSGLDPREVAHMRNMLKARKGKQTIILSSHNLHEVEQICDHVAFIEKGKTLRYDSMDTITGRSHIMIFHTAGGKLPLSRLKELLPESEFHADTSETTLTCIYPAGRKILSGSNRVVLQCLLDAHLDILQMNPGSGLESAYLGENQR